MSPAPTAPFIQMAKAEPNRELVIDKKHIKVEDSAWNLAVFLGQ